MMFQRRWKIEREISTGMDLATWEPLEPGWIYWQGQHRNIKTTFFTKWGAERHVVFLRTLGFRVLRVVRTE